MRPMCVFTAGGLIVVSAAILALPARTAAPSAYAAARLPHAQDSAPKVSGWTTLAPRRRPDFRFATLHALDYAETSGDRLPQPALPSTKDLLREVAQLSDADWLAVQRGGVIAKTLDTDSREVAVAGVVRIPGAPDLLAGRYRDIEVLTRSSLVLGAGAFSAAPAASDLSTLVVEEHSLNLRSCRPGDCHVRLTAEDIRRFIARSAGMGLTGAISPHLCGEKCWRPTLVRT